MKKRHFAWFVVKYLPAFLFSPTPFTVSFSELVFKVRPRSSIFSVLSQTFVRKIYLPQKPIGKVETILDLGGYIGDFTVWAAKKYAPQRIITVEPDKGLYDLLLWAVRKNKVSKKVTALNKAMYSKVTHLMASGPRMQDAGTDFLQEDAKGAVATITLKQLVDTYKLKKIDYFKMDIEGAEKFVLTKENRAIFRNRVRFISLETHEKWGFGKDDAVRYLESLGFEVVHRRHWGRYAEFEAYNRRFA